MGVKQFKFFHGTTIQTEGIQNLIRTLRARWEPEIQQHILTYDAIDAEEELTRLLSSEIARTIDEEMINALNRTINGGQRT